VSTPPSSGGDAGTTTNDPDAIKADIEATREQLAATVDQLSARLDVPARAKEGVARAKDTAVETYRESPPAVIGAGAAAAGLLGLLVAWRFRRARSRRLLARHEKALAKARARETKEAVKTRRAVARNRRRARRSIR
jgi:ElaB/YqjD/DUF883 family membrane-anchored ribosome-binding protein